MELCKPPPCRGPVSPTVAHTTHASPFPHDVVYYSLASDPLVHMVTAQLSLPLHVPGLQWRLQWRPKCPLQPFRVPGVLLLLAGKHSHAECVTVLLKNLPSGQNSKSLWWHAIPSLVFPAWLPGPSYPAKENSESQRRRRSTRLPHAGSFPKSVSTLLPSASSALRGHSFLCLRHAGRQPPALSCLIAHCPSCSCWLMYPLPLLHLSSGALLTVGSLLGIQSPARPLARC